VAATNTITATQWASLVNTLVNMGAQTGTTITARTAPTAGQTINILAALNTDLTNITANRQNAVANGTQFVIFTDQARTLAVNSTDFAGTYTANSGDVVPNGGVIGRLLMFSLTLLIPAANHTMYH
jgi:hypothetical protein